MRPKTYSQEQHQIDPDLIDPDALYVLAKLRNAGYRAYLVGGSVRDLLVKRSPKDYDISTSATPEEIKKLFGRKCILIGRRFRLAHIRFGRKVLEVSTFRAGTNVANSELIVRDNEWGTAEEDVLRRDFTINGLFYDSKDQTVIDYVGGWDDIQKGILRTIGDAEVRFKQDPVRMIRLLKFVARFGFSVCSEAQQALIDCQDEIQKSSPARLLEEIFRMLESGASEAFFRLMADNGLLEMLFPALTHFLQGPNGKKVYQFLKAADGYNNYALDNRRPLLDRSILTACLLFPIVEEELKMQYLNKDRVPHLGEVIVLVNSIINGVITFSFSHFPRRISSMTQFIMTSQYRFTPITGRRHIRNKFMRNKEFPLALRFFKIRAIVKPDFQETYDQCRANFQRFRHQGEKKHHAPPPHPKKRIKR